MSTRYNVEKMRFIVASGKVAVNNPDRLGTVHGKFSTEDGAELSVTSKVITFEDAANPDTIIDIENGILVLPSGERGRKASVSVTQTEIDSLLDTARTVAAS